LGKFWMALKWKVLVYFMALWSVLRPFSIFYGLFWSILGSFGQFFPVLVCFTKKNLATLGQCGRKCFRKSDQKWPNIESTLTNCT
jgi:hypothetical protein